MSATSKTFSLACAGSMRDGAPKGIHNTLKMETLQLWLILLLLVIAFPLPTQSQLATNEPARQTTPITSRHLTSKETEYLRSQGIDPRNVTHSTKTNTFFSPLTPAEDAWARSQGLDPDNLVATFPDDSSTPTPIARSSFIGSPMDTTENVSESAAHPALTSSVNTQIKIPPPIGFVEGSQLSEVLMKRGLVGTPPSVKLLGFYCPPDILAQVLKNGDEAPSLPFCTAKLQTSYPSIPDAKESFKTLVANAKRDELIDRNDPDVKKILQRAANAVNKAYPTNPATIKGIVPIANVIDSETVFAFTALVNATLSEDNRPMAIASAFVLIDTQQLQLGVCYPFTSQADIEAAKDMLLRWVPDIQRLNSPYSQRAVGKPTQASSPLDPTLLRARGGTNSDFALGKGCNSILEALCVSA